MTEAEPPNDRPVEDIVEEWIEERDRVEDDSESEVLEYRYSITSYGADYPVDSLVKRLEDDTIFVPPFQRKFVWPQAQASRFIESLLLGLPVPGIFLAKEPSETNRMLVIDGQQRLRSLQKFYEGVFNNRKFTLTGIKSAFEGKSYKDLSPEDRRRLDDAIIHATIVRQDHPAEDDTSIYLIFERLNTGGTLLSPQEIRACISHGPFVDLLEDLNKNEYWRAVYGEPDKRLKDRELVLRFFALFLDIDNYRRPMKEALNRYTTRNRNLERHDAPMLTRVFSPTIKLVAESLGREAFRPVRAINAAVYDAVMVGLARRIQANRPIGGDAFRQAYRGLLENEDFKAAYSRSTSDEDHVRARVHLATLAFEQV